MLGLSSSQWGALLLVVGVVFYWLRIFQRARAVMAFAGVCLLADGWISSILVSVAQWVSGLAGSLAGKLFGVGLPGILALILGIVFIFDLHPRGGGASKRTFWVGVAFAACLVAGVSAFAQLNGIPADLRSGVSNLGG
jgi:hypothetical protein